MGCGSSSDPGTGPQPRASHHDDSSDDQQNQARQPQSPSDSVTSCPSSAYSQVQASPPAAPLHPQSRGKGRSKGRGKGRGNGRGKGKGKGKGHHQFKATKGHWQIQLSGGWQSVDSEVDVILARAFLIGQPNAKCRLRGKDYEYCFREMVQKNKDTGRERQIRPPCGMKPPPKPVPADKTSVEIAGPYTAPRKLTAAAPRGAAKGSHMPVPVPGGGEPVETAVKKQTDHSKRTGTKAVIGAAAIGGLAVGGVVPGNHLTGGAVTDAVLDDADAGDEAEEVVDDAAEDYRRLGR